MQKKKVRVSSWLDEMSNPRQGGEDPRLAGVGMHRAAKVNPPTIERPLGFRRGPSCTHEQTHTRQNAKKRSQPEKRPRAPLPSAWERSSGGNTRAVLGRQPPPFPSSLALIDVWRGSGEGAKSSPLHDLRLVPVTSQFQFGARPRSPGGRRAPGTLASLWRVPGPEARPAVATAPTQSRLLPLDAWWLDRREGGWLYPPRPQHFRPRSRALPHCPQPRSGRPQGKGRG